MIGVAWQKRHGPCRPFADEVFIHALHLILPGSLQSVQLLDALACCSSDSFRIQSCLVSLAVSHFCEGTNFERKQLSVVPRIPGSRHGKTVPAMDR
ncbi:unnamed protein product [Calypogeia fissa]